MTTRRKYTDTDTCRRVADGAPVEKSGFAEKVLVVLLLLLFLVPWQYADAALLSRALQRSAASDPQTQQPDTLVMARLGVAGTLPDGTPLEAVDTLTTQRDDTVLNVVVDEKSPYGLDGKRIFNPSPVRAVWLSALFPGLGQIYNRRYWKLPIIIGGFMGLGYAVNWNNNQFQDYSQAYRDLLDNDPATNSYMNFFPPTTSEDELDRTWLSSVMQSRKNYYRRNRDLCIICIVGLYLLCMVDAYVDASLSHFDISPSLSMDVQPALIVEPGTRKAALGLNWAFNF